MSTQKFFTLLVITSLFFSCKDKTDDPTHKNPFSFYPLEGAEWYFHDTLIHDSAEGKDFVRFYAFYDTFTLGNLVTKNTQLIHRNQTTGNNDTDAIESNQYYEVVGRSRRIKRKFHNGLIISDSVAIGLSGYVRFDEDSLKVYTLKFNDSENKFYEYLTNVFMDDGKSYIYRPIVDNVTTQRIGDIDFLKTNYSDHRSAYAGINLEHFSEIWLDNIPFKSMYKRSHEFPNYGFQLKYGNRIYP